MKTGKASRSTLSGVYESPAPAHAVIFLAWVCQALNVAEALSVSLRLWPACLSNRNLSFANHNSWVGSVQPVFDRRPVEGLRPPKYSVLKVGTDRKVWR
jgi:hypothetical protein